MSGSDWSERPPAWVKFVGYLGIGLALSALLFGLYYHVYYAQQADDGATEYARIAAAEAYQPCRLSPLAKLNQCLTNAKREYDLKRNDNRRDYADLVAQQRSALWGAVMGIAALIGMVFSAIGVWLVYTTFRETKRSAYAANETLARSHPPRLLLPLIQIWPRGDRNAPLGRFTRGYEIEGFARVINAGREVARIQDCRCMAYWRSGTLPMVRPWDTDPAPPEAVIQLIGHERQAVNEMKPGAEATFEFFAPRSFFKVPNTYRRNQTLYITGQIHYTDPHDVHRYLVFTRQFDQNEGRFVPVDNLAYENEI